MRKLIGLTISVATLAGAGVALGGQATATNAGGEFIDLNVAVSPPVARDGEGSSWRGRVV